MLLKQNPSKIVGVQFSTFSPEEIRRYSVAEITNRNTYAGKKPVLGGLFTPQCGGGDITGSTKQICPTDGLTSTESPGYFAHLELATTLFSMHHIKNILKVCKSTCFACSRLLFSKSQHQHMLEMTPQERTEYAYNLCKKIRRCGVQNEDGCGCKQPDKYELKSIASLFAVWEKVAIVNAEGKKENVKKIVRLYPEMVLKQFKRITDEDMVFLGYHPVWSKPEWFLLTVLPVAPPAVRPSVKPDAQQRSEDDLTHIYSHIVRTNQDLRAAIQENKAEHVIENLRLILQFLVASLVSNKIKGASPMTQRSGRPLQNICSRLNTKHGRIRGNLMGKRVNFSARSVITGDPNLSIRLLGVPLNIAKNITKPVIVNDRNRDYLTHLVQNGPSTYPGAKILERKGFGQTSGGGNQISLRYVDRSSIRLENGDIVHRHLMDGDFVLFNRQPSLHRMSMMAHEVRVMKYGDTFRFNVGDTPPYNADFDGDEMNMHAPQSVQAETELQYLPAIPWQIISPAKNSPVIGIFQDSLLGSYYFTRPHVRLTMLHAMELLCQYTKLDPEILKKMAKKINSRGKRSGEEHTVSSFDVLTHIFPPMTSVNKSNLFNDDKDKFPTSNNVVEIQNGHYLRGQLEKSMFASTSKGILHRICNDFGNRTCADFIDDIQNIINEYMKSSSFSVGISDLIANKTTQREITRVIETQKQEVQLLIEKVHLGIFENKTANSNAAEFELQVNNLLNKALGDAGTIGRNSLGKDNRFVMIVNSGSKGSPHNISQMISCFGQQNIDGKRIPNGFDNRPLPHFCKYDDSPKARGFIENSYITGLTAVEVFYHAMGGRIGLIDTAVKTATTGYIQRRWVKAMEDLVVRYDMTVRNNMGKIIQFRYGDDGFDPVKVESQNLPLLNSSIEDIFDHYDIIGVNDRTQDELSIYTKGARSRVQSQREEARALCRKYIDKMIETRDFMVEKVFRGREDKWAIKIPVMFKSIIDNLQGQLGLGKMTEYSATTSLLRKSTQNQEEESLTTVTDITPLEAFQMIEDYYKQKLETLGNAGPNRMFETLYYYYLTPKSLLVDKRFHRKALEQLLETVVQRYKQAIVHPGEAVGIIAGQSAGELSTQASLNSFHTAAGKQKKSNMTTGVPRIEELLQLTKTPKTPSLTVFLKPADETNSDRAKAVSLMIEYTKLSEIVKGVRILFDPQDDTIAEDQLLIRRYELFEEMIQECNQDGSINAKPDVCESQIPTDEQDIVDNEVIETPLFPVVGKRGKKSKSDAAANENKEKSKWLIRLEMDAETMLDKNITMDDISFILNQHYGGQIACVYSDYNDTQLIFRIRLKTISELKEAKNKKILDKSDEIYILKQFMNNLLENTVLRGIPGIVNVMLREMVDTVFKENGKYTKKNTWLIDTTGSNLQEVLGLDFIDTSRTYSNNVREVAEVLGMEAAVQVLSLEMGEVLPDINNHHLSIIVDKMTSLKNMCAVFRSGIFADNVGPLMKSSFEMHSEVLLNAARHGEFDNARGISASVMLGQAGYFGTSSFQVLLDMKEMEKLKESKAMLDKDRNQALAEGFGDLSREVNEEYCSKAQVTIANNLSLVQAQDHGDCVDEYDMGF